MLDKTGPSARVPPQNLDAERSLLGGILLYSASFVDILKLVKPEDFYRAAHQKIFEAMIALEQKGEPIDRVTLKNALTAKGAFASVGGDDFIDLLDKVVPVSANADYYAKIVHDKAVLRRLIEAGQGIVLEAYAQQGEAATFLDTAEQRILSIKSVEGQTGSVLSMRPLLTLAYKDLQSRYERQEEVTGIATGFIDLDRMTSGFQPGDLVIIAARPSMGKTAFCLNVAANAALRAQFKGKRVGVLLFSLEMPSVQLVTRMLASEARVDSQRMRSGALLESDWPKLAHASGVLSEAEIHIDDSSSLTVLDLRAKCRRVHQQLLATPSPLGLIIIDYLQLMKGNEHIDSREQQISEISRSLKGLAKDLGVPVIALSQLNRSLEKRPDKRPIMSDLRESGAIEQDADTICFLYRDEVYEKDNEEARGRAEVIIGKQRNGPIGTANVTFLHEFTRFENLARG